MIRIGREIQCLPYARFSKNNFVDFKSLLCCLFYKELV